MNHDSFSSFAEDQSFCVLVDKKLLCGDLRKSPNVNFRTIFFTYDPNISCVQFVVCPLSIRFLFWFIAFLNLTQFFLRVFNVFYVQKTHLFTTFTHLTNANVHKRTYES